MVKVRAPELEGATYWINGEVELKKVRGSKVVLLDFFEFTCINCIRTFPYLREWWKRYKDKGLIIVGIHTPEFERSKDINFLKKELERYDITWPVAVDNEYKIWDAYANMYWPRKYLINKDGYIVYDHIGEGKYRETEIEIQKALREITPYIELPEPVNIFRPEDDLSRVCYPRTPETYAGYLRGRFIGKIAYDKDHIYNDPEPKTDGLISLRGICRIEDERTVLLKGKVIIVFKGNSANVVMFGKGKKVDVRIDGKPVPPEMKGEDLFVEDGQTYIFVDGYRMYNIITSEEWGIHKLEMEGEGVEIYAFTFGSCVI